MKKVFYIVFFASLTFFSSSLMADDELERECLKFVDAPEVVITTSYGKLRYDHENSRKTINRLYLNNNRIKGKAKTKTLSTGLTNGLSNFEYKININSKVQKKTIPSGITCVYPTFVNLYFGVGEDPVIYIAREYDKGTCMYKLVLRHEQTHQQIAQSVMESYLPVVKERFVEVVKNNVIASRSYNINISTATDMLKSIYAEVLNDLLLEIEEKTNIEQSKLDNAENYEYETAICREQDQ